MMWRCAILVMLAKRYPPDRKKFKSAISKLLHMLKSEITNSVACIDLSSPLQSYAPPVMTEVPLEFAVPEMVQVCMWQVIWPLVLHSVLKEIGYCFGNFWQHYNKRVLDSVCSDVFEGIKANVAKESDPCGGKQRWINQGRVSVGGTQKQRHRVIHNVLCTNCEGSTPGSKRQ